MRWLLVACFVGYISGSTGSTLWPQGVVHYSINTKDYDLHSQDEITSTIDRIQNEVCLKFFKTPANYSADEQHKILYISNPDKRKDCPPLSYDFSGTVVNMPIGYRCINQKEIARIIIDMLKASVGQTPSSVNSIDLVKRFREQEDQVAHTTLLKPSDRDYLNANYHAECGALRRRSARRDGDEEPTRAHMSAPAALYYARKLWPLAVLMYGVHPDIRANDPDLMAVKLAMSTIELSSCIVFQRIASQDVLEPKNFLWLGLEGEDMPNFGFKEGNQTLNLHSLGTGAPGHAAHALHALLRALGVPMMSNRFDRDNFISIEWKNVASGKEHYLEKGPEEAWLKQIPYDFNSATHAPANYMCRDCNDPLASRTVLPHQDHLWQRTLSMGRRAALSESDERLLSILYTAECRNRFMRELK